jgi:hypothetical protein
MILSAFQKLFAGGNGLIILSLAVLFAGGCADTLDFR